MTSVLVSSKHAGNLKLVWFQVHNEFQRKTTQNPKLALSSSPRIENLKGVAYRNEKRMLCALEAFGHLSRTLYRRPLGIKSVGKEFVRTGFKASSTCVQRRRLTAWRFVSSLEHCKPAIGQTTKNKWVMLSEQQANSVISLVKLSLYLPHRRTACLPHERLTDAETQQC